MKILVTGANGACGRTLVPELRRDPANQLVLLDLRPGDDRDCLELDLTRQAEVLELVRRERPDRIYHLAGTFTNDYELDHASNVLATRHLLEAALACRLEGLRVLLIGSAAEYGRCLTPDRGISEDHPLNPVSVYGLCKAMQSLLMKFYVTRHGLDLVMARPFNLLGPGLSTNLFIGTLYHQIQAVQAGRQDRIKLGALEDCRDYLPLHEAVKCFIQVMQRGTKGETYNIGSGRAVRMRDLLQQVLMENGLSMEIVDYERNAASLNSASWADVTKFRALPSPEWS